jgi:amino acid adenylation domain-containing protein
MRGGVPQLQDYLHDTAQRIPDKVALVHHGRRLSYGELEAQSNALAHALVRRGVARGDRVVVFTDNSLESAVAFMGVLKANAVVSMVNPLTKAEKLATLLADCQARALITQSDLAAPSAIAARACPSLSTVIVIGDFDAGRFAGRESRAERWDVALAGEPDDRPPPRRNVDVDLASLIYTSGTTGEPKGVMLSHRGMMTVATSVATYLENREDDVILAVLPFAFTYGIYQLVTACHVGARLVLERSFSYPAQVLGLVVDEGVTGFPGVPTIFAILSGIKNLEHYDFSKVRYVTNAAAALSVKHIEVLKRVFPNAKIFSMYGQTECARATYLPPGDIDRKPTSIGVAIPNTELWLVDERDERVGPGQPGQLVVRGATLMRGYWGKPEETSKKLRPGPVPGESVLYTGDCCKTDDDGYFYFVSRMDDIIKSAGEKVSPKEVEHAIVNLPGVKEAAVIGVPDPVLGQAIKAFVVLEEGAVMTERQVILECQRRLENFMVPKIVEFRPDLPKTMTGKIKKTDLT